MSLRELLVLVAMSAVWGFHFVVIKTAVAEIPPMFYAALRMTLVAVLLAPFLRWRPGQMGAVLAGGLCFGALNYAFLFNGVERASASASAIAIELYAPFATILSVVFLGEKVGWRRSAGIALAFAGVALIAVAQNRGADGGPQQTLGIALVAMGAFIEAVGAIVVKRLKGLRPHEMLAWFGLVGTVALWAATLIFERDQAQMLARADKPTIIGAIVYSAVAASIFGHTAYYWLIQRLPISQVAPSALLTTLLAVVFSVLLLGDPVSPAFLVGGAMTLVGVGVVLLRGSKSGIVIAEAVAPEPIGAAPAPLQKSAEP